MKHNHVFVIFMSLLTIVWADSNTDPNHETNFYGQVQIARILNIDNSCTLYCDIQNFPPVIGKNIPVKLNGFKPSASDQANQKIKSFLVELLILQSDPSDEVYLYNIQRGNTFCLHADILCDNQDLGELLIKKGLAHRVIEVQENQSIPKDVPENTLTLPTSPAIVTTANKYVASKASKIFHRADCYHVRRMDAAQTLNFSSRDKAINSGRRPCKTCNP